MSRLRGRPGMELLDAIHDHINLLAFAVRRVEAVAENLHSVGLEKPAEQLEAAIENLVESAKAIQHANSDSVNDQIRHSEAMIGGMLKLVMDDRIRPKEKSS